MKDRRIPAIRGRSNVVPPRLLLVPNLAEFAEGAQIWTPEMVDRIMAWTDIEQAAGQWQGIAIAAPTLSFKELYLSAAFKNSWREWTNAFNKRQQRSTRIVVQDVVSDEYFMSGPNGAALIAEVTVFSQDFFGFGRGPNRDSLGQQLNFWAGLFDRMLPNSESTLCPGKNIEQWFNDGDISLADPHHRHQQVVVLRGAQNEQENASCFPLNAAYRFPAAS